MTDRTTTTEPTDQGEQYVMPGAERLSAPAADAQQLAMRQAAPLRGRREQRSVTHLPLFDPPLL